MGALSRKEIDDIFDSVPQATSRADIDAVYDAPAPSKPRKSSYKPISYNRDELYDARNYAPKNREMTQEEKMLLDRDYRDQVWEEERKNRIPKLEAPRTDYAGYAREEIQAEKDLSDYALQKKQRMYDQNRSRNEQRRQEQANRRIEESIEAEREEPARRDTNRLKREEIRNRDDQEKRQAKQKSFDLYENEPGRSFDFSAKDKNADLDRIDMPTVKPYANDERQALIDRQDRIEQNKIRNMERRGEDILDTWLDPDYKMSKEDEEQAERIIKNYDATEYKNSNIYDLTPEEQEKQSKINALRDKVSNSSAAIYGAMNATVNPLMTAADNDFYGWTLDDLRNEVAIKRDIPMNAEERAIVGELRKKVDDIQKVLDDPNTVYSTGDAAIDEITGATVNANKGEMISALEDAQKQLYKTMLEIDRGTYNKIDYDSYTYRKENARKQSPVAYYGGDLGTRVAESVAGQAALANTGYGQALEAINGDSLGGRLLTQTMEDLPVDLATDTIPELLSNKASGMSDKEVMDRLVANVALNTGINAGVAGLRNAREIGSAVRHGIANNVLNRLDDADVREGRQILNSLVAREGADEITQGGVNAAEETAQALDNTASDALRNADEITSDDVISEELPWKEPADMVRQNEIDVDALNAERQQAVDEIQRLNQQIPNRTNTDIFDAPKTINAGRATFIDTPYTGETPISLGRTIERVDVKPDYYNNAVNAISDAKTGQDFTGRLKKIYNELFDKKGGQHRVASENVSFGGEEYVVDVNKKAVAEVVNKGRISPEKLSVLEDIDDVISNGEYVGSGAKNINHKKNPNIIRYDYFETPVSINGKDYIVTYDVEVYKGSNNYKTHKVVDEINLIETAGTTKSSSDGVAATLGLKPNAPTQLGLDQTAKAVDSLSTPNINQIDNSVKGVTNSIDQPIKRLNEVTPDNVNTPAQPIRRLDEVTETDVNSPLRELDETTNTNPGPGGGSVKYSKMKESSIPKSEFQTEAERLDTFTDEDLRYMSHTQRESLEQANRNLSPEFRQATEEMWLGDLHTGEGGLSSSDVDTAMMLYRDYAKQRRLAEAAGDMATVSQMTKNIRTVLNNLQKNVSKAAQELQALVKWSYTPDGAIMQADAFIAGRAAKASRAVKSSAESASNALKEELSNIDTNLVEQAREASRVALDNEGIADQVEGVVSERVRDAELMREIERGLRRSMNQAKSGAVTRNVERNFQRIQEQIYDAIVGDGDIERVFANYDNLLETGILGLSDDTEMEIRQMIDDALTNPPNSKARIDKMNEVYSRLASEMNLHGTFKEKLDTWRYFAMLANPRTHIRNLLGNVLFGGVNRVKDNVGALIEGAVDKATKGRAFEAPDNVGEEFADVDWNRTKSFLNKFNDKDKALVNGADEYLFNNAYGDVAEGNHWIENMTAGLEGNKDVYRTAWLNKLTEGNTKLLDKEDELFLRLQFRDSMARYLKANGEDATIFGAEQALRDQVKTLGEYTGDPNDIYKLIRKYAEKGEVVFPEKLQKEFIDRYGVELPDDLIKQYNRTELLMKAKNYAVDRAKEATFHTASKLADAIKKIKNPAAKVALDALVPFRRTPINILKQSLGYSPLGIASTIWDAFQMKSLGKVSASKVIDDISKNITGSMGVGMGFFLAKAGLLTNTKTDDGQQKFAIKVPGGTYTINWAAPSAVPLLIGAAIGEQGKVSWDSVLNAGLGSIDAIIDTTMLDGLSNMLKTIQQSDNYRSGDTENNQSLSAVGSAITQLGTGYATQFIPTMLGNIARTMDKTRRSTYTSDTGVKGGIEKTGIQSLNKIPKLSELSEPYINRYGEEEENVGGNALGRLAYNMLSPGFFQKDRQNPIEDELYRLNQSDANVNGVDLLETPYTTRVKNGEARFTREQKTFNDRATGEARVELYNEIENLPYYDELNDANKIKLYDAANDLAVKLGKERTAEEFGMRYTNTDKDVKAYHEEGGAAGAVDYLLGQYGIEDDEGNMTEQLSDEETIAKDTAFNEFKETNNVTSTKAQDTFKETGDETVALAVQSIAGLDTNADKIKKLEESGASDYDKGYAFSQYISEDDMSEIDQSYIDKGDYEGLYKFEKFVSDNGITSKRAKGLYVDGDEEGAIRLNTVLSSGDKNSDYIKRLNNMTDVNNADKGKTLSHAISQPAKKAQSFIDSGKYEDFYLYYDIKTHVDRDGGGRLSAEEKKQIIPYLKDIGLSGRASEISGWY